MLVNWDIVRKPKCMGGLAITNIIDLNNVLLTKMGWHMMKGESNWYNIMRAKYLENLKFSHCT